MPTVGPQLVIVPRDGAPPSAPSASRVHEHLRWPTVALRALTGLCVGLCVLLLPMLSIAAVKDRCISRGLVIRT